MKKPLSACLMFVILISIILSVPLTSSASSDETDSFLDIEPPVNIEILSDGSTTILHYELGPKMRELMTHVEADDAIWHQMKADYGIESLTACTKVNWCDDIFPWYDENGKLLVGDCNTTDWLDVGMIGVYIGFGGPEYVLMCACWAVDVKLTSGEEYIYSTDWSNVVWKGKQPNSIVPPDPITKKKIIALPTTTTTLSPTTSITTITTTSNNVITTTLSKPIPNYILGDVNNDNYINMKDVLVLRKHLADMPASIDLKAADVNADGTVNMKDVLMLRKYLADMIDKLGA